MLQTGREEVEEEGRAVSVWVEVATKGREWMRGKL